MNNANFKHYIVTRFNVPYPQTTYNGVSKGIDPGYLKQRFELFEKYTVPSMQNQTVKNFEWVILFDKNTPSPFMDKILDYEKRGVFKPVFVDKLDYSTKTVRELVNADIELDNIPVITSRVDNDDAVMFDYVESIQAVAKNILPKRTYLTSLWNFRLDTKKEIVTKYKMRKNHFVSCTGMLDEVTSNVYRLSQDEMPKSADGYTVVPGIHCVEIVHESNLLNHTKYKFSGIVSAKEYKRLKKEKGYDIKPYAEVLRISVIGSTKSIPTNLSKFIKEGFGFILRKVKKG